MAAILPRPQCVKPMTQHQEIQVKTYEKLNFKQNITDT